jgi:hypothetical protein
MNLGCISRWNGRRGTKLRKASGVPFPLGRKNFSAILKRKSARGLGVSAPSKFPLMIRRRLM